MEQWLQRLQLRWLDRLQSGLVLPTARTLYLAVAGLCVLAAAIGLLTAGLFQIATWQGAHRKQLPEIVSGRPQSIDYSKLDSRLSPPTNIRLVVDADPLVLPAYDGQSIGHFEADTPNGMAAYPEGFQIIGGRDGELFESASDGASGRTLLRIKSPLAEQINGFAPNLRTTKPQSFSVRILAHDSSGNHADPVDVNFALTYAPNGTPPAPAPVEGEPEIPADLKAIAIRIAHIADPTHATPAYHDAYHFAVGEPQRCEAAGDQAFIVHYGRSFTRVRARLTSDKLGAFYAGVCEAWRDSLQRAADASATSVARRAQVIAENDAAQAQAMLGRMSATKHRNAALIFVGGAIFAFMTIALFLAFLAMEGHSNAVRQAVELLASRHRPDDQPSVSTTPTAGG